MSSAIETDAPLPPVNAQWEFADKLHARSMIAGALGFISGVRDTNPHLASVADPLIAEFRRALNRE